MKTYRDAKEIALEALRNRIDEIEAAIERLEAGDQTVLLEAAAIPDF